MASELEAPEISGYTFGRITIEATNYRRDLILFPDGSIKEHWWRRQGHVLEPEDLGDLFATPFDTLVVGTGAFGRLRVTDETIETCRRHNVGIEVLKTEDAVRKYNDLIRSGRAVVACLHLTC